MANSQYNFLDYAGLALFWSKVKNIIEDNELVTATALTNLDTRVDTVEDALANQIISITYTNLRTLKNSGQLVPGQQYRITDYKCSTSQVGTVPVGHVFDIIVTADSNDKLNEEARATLHVGDTYFKDCNLSAWKIWYCIDNDTTRFAWADKSALGKGVIYRMIDEFGNDCPYDFKNIQFYRVWDSSKSLWSTMPNSNAGLPCYTFSSEASSSTTSVTDMSLSAFNGVHSNVIKEYILNPETHPTQTLNNICFFGSSCLWNTFGGNCYNNTFESNCYYNTFGSNCFSNTFGFNCYSNTFGNDCNSNSFVSSCYRNIIGNFCSSNNLGSGCYNNSFGNNCTYNTVGSDCNSNTFGNSCSYIKFASSSSTSATKYNYYQYNRFGDGCKFILFKGTETASGSAQVQNYNFAQGLQGTSSSYLSITAIRKHSYETTVAKNSSGTVKTYCATS